MSYNYTIVIFFFCLAPASYAEARIWLDEQIRFNSNESFVAIYNMPFLSRLNSGYTLSTIRLRQALQHLLIKHQSLRTSLIFDKETNQLLQRIIDFNNNSRQLFTFIESIFETDEQLNNIIQDENSNSQLFDLTQGLVFRYHIVYYKEISLNSLLCDQDVIIFNFHHALFDFPSMDMFLDDLSQAYRTGQLTIDDKNSLRYLDCEHEYFSSLLKSYLCFLHI